MTNTVEKLVSLIRDTSSSLPADVEAALKKSVRMESAESGAAVILKTILQNVTLARRQRTPLCQDTGTLTFFIDERLRRRVPPKLIRMAVANATRLGYLRKNCLDSVTGKSFDDNCAADAPVIHYLPSGTASLQPGSVTLLMKGGGSENMSRQYSLPDSSLGAGRDLAGVRACILDTVQKAQGYGCAPGILGVCIGGDRATGYAVAKEQLLRPLPDRSADMTLRKLERQLLSEANSLGIGPMGLGGKTTLLGVKIASRPRLPASYFVTIAYVCWALRRRSIAL